MNVRISTSSSSLSNTDQQLSVYSSFLQRTIKQLFAYLLYQEQGARQDISRIVQEIHYFTSQQFVLVNSGNIQGYIDRWKQQLGGRNISIQADLTKKELALQQYATLTEKLSIDSRVYEICRGCLDSKEARNFFPKNWKGNWLLRISCSDPRSASFGRFVLADYDGEKKEFKPPQAVDFKITLDRLKRIYGENYLAPSGLQEQKMFWSELVNIYQTYEEYIYQTVTLKDLQERTVSQEKVDNWWEIVQSNMASGLEEVSSGAHQIKFGHQSQQKAPYLCFVNQDFCLFLSSQLCPAQFLCETISQSKAQVFLTFGKEKQEFPKTIQMNGKTYEIKDQLNKEVYASEKVKIFRRLYTVNNSTDTQLLLTHLAYEGDDSFEPEAFVLWQKALYEVAPQLMNHHVPLWIYGDHCPQISRFLIGYDIYLQWQKCLLSGYEPEKLGELEIFLQAYLFQIKCFWKQNPVDTPEQFSILLKSLSYMGTAFKHDYFDEVVQKFKQISTTKIEDDDIPPLSQVTQETDEDEISEEDTDGCKIKDENQVDEEEEEGDRPRFKRAKYDKEEEDR